MCREGAWTELTVSVTAGLSIPGGVLGFFMEKTMLVANLFIKFMIFSFMGWVYEYCFTKENKGLSTNHAGELPYFYGCLATEPQNYTKNDYELSDTIVSYITNFAKTGNPNDSGLPKWPTYSEKPDAVLELGESVGMMEDPYLELYNIIDKAQGYDYTK